MEGRLWAKIHQSLRPLNLQPQPRASLKRCKLTTLSDREAAPLTQTNCSGLGENSTNPLNATLRRYSGISNSSGGETSGSETRPRVKSPLRVKLPLPSPRDKICNRRNEYHQQIDHAWRATLRSEFRNRFVE